MLSAIQSFSQLDRSVYDSECFRLFFQTGGKNDFPESGIERFASIFVNQKIFVLRHSFQMGDQFAPQNRRDRNFPNAVIFVTFRFRRENNQTPGVQFDRISG